jgi:hypothetical protein
MTVGHRSLCFVLLAIVLLLQAAEAAAQGIPNPTPTGPGCWMWQYDPTQPIPRDAKVVPGTCETPDGRCYVVPSSACLEISGTDRPLYGDRRAPTSRRPWRTREAFRRTRRRRRPRRRRRGPFLRRGPSRSCRCQTTRNAGRAQAGTSRRSWTICPNRRWIPFAATPISTAGSGPERQLYRVLEVLVPSSPHRKCGQSATPSVLYANRNMAVPALAAWDRTKWPGETELLLRHALKDEPNEHTRESMRKVLNKKPLQF